MNDSIRESRKRIGQIVSLLLKEGMLNKKQLAYALRVQSKIETPKTLLDVIKELEYLTDDQIRSVIRKNIGAIRIGDLLVELGQITESELQACLKIQSQQKTKMRLGELLVSHNFIKQQTLLEILSMQLGFPLIEPRFADISPELIRGVRLSLLKEFMFLPVKRVGDRVLVAFADPTDKNALQAAKAFLGCELVEGLASKDGISEVLGRIQPGSKSAFLKKSDVPVVELVDSIILEAIDSGASDIHIEPMKDRLRVRFRQDGVLVHYKDFSKDVIPQLTSRVKIMCRANIAEKRRHQGGRIDFRHDKGDVDLRVSFYVTVFGEKIVLRLLRRQTHLLKMEDIGMSPRMLKRFREEALDCPSGVILITGPTGSGKTTTVYSCINYLNTPETSIITAEEPVEYVVDGIAQCSIDPEINLTFEETLRHIVRQDPDVVVIGEIRDTFSAQVAVQAALTGHKVLTTFHTEDSIGGLVRLLNMKVDAFLISSTVVCVIAQRLLRRLCPECKTSYRITPADIHALGYGPKDALESNFQIGRGCEACRHTGYKGRIAVLEMLILDEPVRDAILERKTSHQIRTISIESSGLLTLMEDGIVKAAAGHTSIREVLRCLPRLHKPRPLPQLRHALGI